MVKAQIFLEMEMLTLGTIKMGNPMEEVSILGRMDLSMLENSRMALSMVKEDGKVEKDLSPTNMMEITVMIRNMAMEFSLGPVVIFIKVNTKMMKEMDTER
jgi:hypothetical protein